jgi:hypothetical protein
MAISKGGWWAAQQPASSTPASTTTETPSADSTTGGVGGVERKMFGGSGGMLHAKGNLPADIWSSTGEPIDAYGAYMNPYGQVIFPSTEAMQSALRDPSVRAAMQSGQYGSQWQELVGDPVVTYGMATGQTMNTSSGPFDDIMGDLADIPGLTSLSNIPGLDAPELDFLFPTVFSEDVHRQAGLGYAGPAGAAGLSVLSGASPEETAKNAGMSWLVSQGADLAAPYVSEGVDKFRRLWDEIDATDPGTFQQGAGMIGEPLYSTVPETDVFGRASTPAMTTYAGPTGSAIGGTVAPSAMGNIGGMLALDPALAEEDAANRDALEAGDVPPTEPTVTGEQLQGYAKAAQKLYDLLGEADGAPQRAEGQSDGEYSQQLAEYMSLDAQEMADAGLQPGTPEYMEYIMAQADAVIAQALEGVDVDAADLASQLRGKTEAEMQQLQRALFVRGQMGQLMGTGTYSDPFTGAEQEVVGDGMFNPAVGAYQRGRAQDVESLAGMGGGEALSFLDSLIGRQGDPFGMQASADARAAQDRLRLPEDDDLRRRRGMFY